ncbi:MAG: DUF1800 family protein [Phycisphaerales bacterium]|nr:DUF1800 family protein [Phycisphaerales bacterium]MCB9862336.1 DUF1800 family protein [Phycisphaerales bacterium]
MSATTMTSGKGTGASTSDAGLDCTPALPSAEEITTRRAMLRGTALAAAMWGAKAYGQTMQNPGVEPIQVRPPVIACPSLVGGPTKEQKLVSKATFGYTQAEEARVVAMGYNAWLDEQLDFTNVPGWVEFEDSLLNPVSGRDPWFGQNLFNYLLDDPGGPLCEVYPPGPHPDVVRRELVRAACIRAVYSPAQLYERAVGFWNDHLTTYHRTGQLPKTKHFGDRLHIRPNALGNVRDIILASATSPDMLEYLDGRTNKKTSINENYGRELLELHTLGKLADGSFNCFDQATIAGIARALTGWYVDTYGTGECGIVSFITSWHDGTAKSIDFPCDGSVFTLQIPAGLFAGPEDIDNSEIAFVIDALTDPSQMGLKTAEFIARKLCVYFSGDNPSASLVQAVVAAYVANYRQNDIAAMIRVILSQQWIHCGKPKLKRPIHLMASALRSTEAAVSDPGQDGQADRMVGGFLERAGHIPFDWPAPDGFSFESSYWVTSLLPRWNFGARLAAVNTADGKFNGVSINTFITDLANMQFPDATSLVNHLDQVMFGGHMGFSDRAELISYVSGLGAINATVIRECVGLLLGAPSFQLY